MTMTLDHPATEAPLREHPEPTVAWEDIDPETALQLLDANFNNRSLRARVVNGYARDMQAGRWLLTGETIKVSWDHELLDGEHRLQAIVQTGLTQKVLVVRGLDPATRAVIDTGAARTAGDALRMAGLGGRNHMALAAAARLLSLWQDERLTRYSSGMRDQDRATHQEVLDMVRQRPDLEEAIADSQRDYERIGLPVGPQAMARTVLADVDAGDAAKFFDALAGYSTDGPNDPRAVLLFTLKQMRALGQLRRPGESVGLTFAAWNAWRDGQRITSLPVRDAKGAPLAIQKPV